MNAAGLDLLKHYEGFSASAYRDMVGVWTIGFGFTEGVKPGDTMTMAQAIERLQKELSPRETAVRLMCSKTATDNQHAALTSLGYNIGLQSLGHSTAIRKHNLGDFDGAADAILMWDKAGGKTVPGLIRRRHAERTLYLTSERQP